MATYDPIREEYVKLAILIYEHYLELEPEDRKMSMRILAYLFRPVIEVK